MPLTIEPPKKTQGRGSAPGTRRRRTGRRPQLYTEASSIPESSVSKTPSTHVDSFIGQEIVDLQQPATKGGEIMMTHSSKNNTRVAAMPQTFAEKGMRRSHHTLCLDTRFIDTKAGRDVGLEIVDGFKSFVKYLGARGDYCNISATTKSRMQEPIIDFATVRRSPTIIPIQGVALHAASFPTGNEVSTPESLSADTSWNLFTRMIVSMLSDPEQQSKENCHSPLEFTILSSDMALFSDTSSTRHFTCFQKFVTKIMDHHQAHRLSVIRLVVVETNILAIKTDQASTVESNKAAYDASIAQCISAIKGIMDETEINGTPTSSTAQLVQYSLTMIDGSAPSYQALCCKLFRESLGSHDLRRRISFDLPETPDGTQCCISFDVFFQTFPYKPGSQEAKCLVGDLHRLSSCSFDIIQLVPISCVDASLLYGVPFALNTVLEQNFDRNEETECLTTIFFRYLKERDLSVLLKGLSTPGQLAQVDQSEDVQYFLLMPQEFPEAMNTPPRSGLLFHYANASQLISEAVRMKSNKNLESELGLQYTDYIENAMSTLECKPFNPLLSEIARISEGNTSSFYFDSEHQKEYSDLIGNGKTAVDSFNASTSTPLESHEEDTQSCVGQSPTKVSNLEESSNSKKAKKRGQVTRAPFNSPSAVMSHVIASTDSFAEHTRNDSQQKLNGRSENEVDDSDIEEVRSAFEYDL